MLRKSKKQPQTVADKVSQLLAHPNGSDSEEDSDFDAATGPRVVDFEQDEYDLPDGRSTDIRKRNVKLLSEQSERYKGKISSRKELEDDQSEEDVPYEDSDSDEENDALAAFNQKLKAKAGKLARDDDNDDGESDGEDDDDDDDDEDDALSSFNQKLRSGTEEAVDSAEEDDEDFDDEEDDDDEDDDVDDDDEDDEEADDSIKPSDVMSKSNPQAEIQKGLCVQNQLRIWERLLELRINTQKVTSKANQLPPPETLKTVGSENEELQSVLSEARERSSKLLQQLLALQSALIQQNSETRISVKRKTVSSEDTEPPLKVFANFLQSNFENMSGYRNEVLLKWDDRTKLLTPGAGLKRKSLQEDYDIIKKIDSALANREALVEKSQTLKSNIQPEKQQQENEPPQRQAHVYDDSDFYHQQLRELIEYKASTSSNMSEITKQFVELQKLRQKMKKKVDTRASKGRKLRYVVHNKLTNFMAPNEASEWTESSKSELYKSLFV
ncbi:protein Aatf [Drosophila pseudoobscura]|uniref:Protein Aatf n=1 Tax=Drosophila pseudoobscura pseudoobscura TaxID=46245 RepID=A0A6I8UX44_DROPS|nr:protein Aatf [Drosophila pseudoobscura]